MLFLNQWNKTSPFRKNICTTIMNEEKVIKSDRPLDEIDRGILEILQEDAKSKHKEIAAQLGLSTTPIYERIKRLENEGIIEKHVAVLDAYKLLGMEVFCSVSLENQKLETIESFGKAIKSIPEVVDCYLMGGSSDFMLRVVVENLDHYHQFSSGKLATISNVAQIKSMFVLDKIKSSTVRPVY